MPDAIRTNIEVEMKKEVVEIRFVLFDIVRVCFFVWVHSYSGPTMANVSNERSLYSQVRQNYFLIA